MNREELIEKLYDEYVRFLSQRQIADIIDLVISTQPTKEQVIEAVKACSDGIPYSQWDAGIEFGLEVAVKAMEKLYGESDE